MSWKTLLKWMIWGSFTPIFGNTHLAIVGWFIAWLVNE